MGNARKCQAPRAGPAWRQGGCGRTDAGAPGGVRQDCAWGKGTFNAGLEGWKRASRRWSRRRGWEPAGTTHVPPCPTAGQAHTGTSSCALPHGLDTSGVTPPFPTLAAHTSLRVRGGARGPPRGSGETGRTAARAGLPAPSVLHGPDGSLSFRLPQAPGPAGRAVSSRVDASV